VSEVIDRGHNRPPELIDINDPAQLTARLERDHNDLVQRFADITIGIEQVPEIISDEDTATRVVDFVGQQVRGLADDAKKIHTQEKAPFLVCGRAVDNFFLRRIDKLNAAVAPVMTRAQAYLRRKLDEQRAREEQLRREAEAKRLAEEAEARRLAAEAQRAIDEGERRRAAELKKQAEAATERAAQAEAIEHAPPTPVRLHGDYGATAFAVERWLFDYEDLNLLPPQFWMPDEAAIKKAIGRGVRDIPGLRIYREDAFRIKRC
jgi:hypothetical protein